MEILLSLFYVVIFSLVIRYVPFFKSIPGLSFSFLLFFFLLKMLSGVSLILIYQYFYDLSIADFNKYYVDGKIMFSALAEHPADYFRMLSGIGMDKGFVSDYLGKMTSWFRPWELPVYNDNRIMVRFNAIVSLISGGYLHVHSVIINFLSFSGLVAIYRFFIMFTNKEKVDYLKWGVFLFPGLLFWGSGVLKEGLMIFSFGFWAYYTSKLYQCKKLSFTEILIFIVSIYILVFLKPYNLIFFVPLQFVFFLSRRQSLIKQQVYYALSVAVLVAIGLVVGYLFPYYDPLEIIAQKQNDFINYSVQSEAGSLIHTRYIKPELTDMLLFFPRGILNVLIRPHIFEIYSPVVLLAALENLIIVFMIVFMILFPDRRGHKNSLVYLSVWFFIFLIGFIGLVTPLHGAFVRYKILALPFLWYIFIHITSVKEIPVVKRFF